MTSVRLIFSYFLYSAVQNGELLCSCSTNPGQDIQFSVSPARKGQAIVHTEAQLFMSAFRAGEEARLHGHIGNEKWRGHGWRPFQREGLSSFRMRVHNLQPPQN